MTDTDIVIVGGGVVGVACAAQTGAAGYSVALIERHPKLGMETSTHNSGVVHAGLYYPAGSLKAQLCVDGAARLYSFCAAHRVPHDRCGKLVVASQRRGGAADRSAGRSARRRTASRAWRSSAGSSFEAREPHVAGDGRAVVAAHRPGRAAEALVRALLRVAQSNEAMVLAGTTRPRRRADRRTGSSFAPSTSVITTRVVVNAAGLYADEVSAALGGERFTIYPCRGEYAELRKTPGRLGQRPGLSRAAAVRPRPGRPPDQDPGRRRAARSDGALPGAEGRL